MLLVMMLSIPQATTKTDEARGIEAAKNADVHRIESSLPDKPFEQWIRELVGPQAGITWEVNDCGEQTGNPASDTGRDLPICATAKVTLSGNRKLYVSLWVGTYASGIRSDKVSLYHTLLVEPDGSMNWVKTLARLPDAIRAAK
jgi:hypothetical protein